MDVVFTYSVLYTLLHKERLKLCIKMKGRRARQIPFGIIKNTKIWLETGENNRHHA
jgi:hypothetical protein